MYLLTLKAIKLENNQPNSLTKFVRTSIDWTAFLISKFIKSFAMFSFVTVWKENEELVPFIWFLIAMALRYSHINSIFNQIMRNVPSIKKILFGIYSLNSGLYLQKVIKSNCDPFSSLTNVPFSSSVIVSADFILVQKRGFTVVQNFLLFISFRSRFS